MQYRVEPMAGQFTEEPKMDRITQDAVLPIQIIHTYVCVCVCVRVCARYLLLLSAPIFQTSLQVMPGK